MSSELFVLDDEVEFISDPFCLSDSSIDSILQELSDEQITQQNHTVSADHEEEAHSFDQIGLTHVSNSPPLLPSYNPFLEVKTEGFQMGFEPWLMGNCSNFERSCSSSSLEDKLGFGFEPWMETLFQPMNMRRVSSTGDLPEVQTNQMTNAKRTGGEEMEEATNMKMRKYTAEERKERIDRYRAKRTLRNFNKTIKYACRKTLADNRPRIRGRFARNDETPEIPQPTPFFPSQDDDDLWMESNFQEEETKILGGVHLNCFGGTQYHHYSAF